MTDPENGPDTPAPDQDCPPIDEPQRQALNIWNYLGSDLQAVKVENYLFKTGLGWVSNPCIAKSEWSGTTGSPPSWAPRTLAGDLVTYSGIAEVQVNYTLSTPSGDQSVLVSFQPNRIDGSKVSFKTLAGSATGTVLLNERDQVQIAIRAASDTDGS